MFSDFFHRLFNTARSTDAIQSKITERRKQRKPTRLLEEELAARASSGRSGGSSSCVSGSGGSGGGSDDSYNQTYVNPNLSTPEICSRIADRESRGLSAKHLRDELSSR